MRGTEKQIAWAEEIRANVIKVLAQGAADIASWPGDEAVKAANVEALNARIAALEAAEYAGDIITIFKGTRFTGIQEKDFKAVIAEYRVSKPLNAGQKKILCK